MLDNQKSTENYVSFDDAMPVAPYQSNFPAAIDPDAPHWNPLAAIGLWILSIVLMIMLSGLAVAIYIAGKGVNLAELQQANLEKDPLIIIANLAAIFPAHLLTIAAAWFLVTRGGKQPFWQTLGWNFDRFAGSLGFLLCIAVTVALYGTAIGIIALMGEQENDLIRILQSSRTAVFLTAAMATFTAPLVEELVYRGVLYPAFKKSFGTFAAIFLVTILFSAVHVPQYLPSYGTILVITILSLVLTVIRAYTKSLLPCFVIHTLFNGFQAILLILAPYITPTTEAPVVDPSPAIVWFAKNLF